MHLDNYRKRTEREIAEIQKRAAREKLLKEAQNWQAHEKF